MRRPVVFSQRALLSLLLVLTGAGPMALADEPESPPGARDKTARYYQDAQLCRARSAAKSPPEAADPAVFIDVEGYLRCINQLGYRQDLKTDPLLVGIRRCGNQKIRIASASGEVLWRNPSQAQMRVCLAARGFPSSGRPPAPNAVSALPADLQPAATITKNPAPSARPWESGDQDRVETVIIPPRSGTR